MLPASAGMFPPSLAPIVLRQYAPRKRGDVPKTFGEVKAKNACSPQARGCSPLRWRRCRQSLMLPASAGMFPVEAVLPVIGKHAPRKRGEVPRESYVRRLDRRCSPQARGCSHIVYGV